MVFNPSRFEMQRMHITKSIELLTCPEKLKSFALDACYKRIPYSWMSEKDKIWKKSTKLVGTTFKKMVLDNHKDALVLIYHPKKDKNRGLKQKLEALSEHVTKTDQDILVARYNGVNESSAFKKPSKLPAIIYFRKDNVNPEDSKPVKSQIVYE